MPKLSLRAQLVVPFVVLILILTATIAGLSYEASQRTALKLADNLTIQVAERVRNAVERHVAPSSLVLEATLPSLRDNLENRDDTDLRLAVVESKLRAATRLHLNPNHLIYYGNVANQFVGVSRADDRNIELRLQLDPTKHREFFNEHTPPNLAPVRTLTKTETSLYVPQSRPWFKAAVATKGPAWTNVYSSFSNNELTATLAHPIYRRDGSLDGVLGTDISLARLNDFLTSVSVSANGAAVLIEANGDIIASSFGAPLFVESNGVKKRLNAAQSDNLLIREAYAQLAPSLTGVPMLESIIRDFPLSELGTIHAALDDLPSSVGLKWYSIVAVPHQDFMAGARTIAWRSIIIGALIAATALLLAYTVLNRVARDLKVLYDATKVVGHGPLVTQLPTSRNDEIGALARQFERMQIDLQEDKLTGAINRETFTRIVTDRLDLATATAPLKKSTFAILFIDLNGFKEINDTYGHQTGDEVLIAVAKRARAAARSTDLVARFGGDEFTILLDNVADKPTAHQAAQKILSALKQPLTLQNGVTVTINAAVGIALHPVDGEDLETLLKIADSRMYQDKAANNPIIDA